MPSKRPGISKRKFQRAHVKKRVRAVFLFCPELSSEEVRVTNISETGLGIETSLIQHPVKLNQLFKTKLKVGYSRLTLWIKLVHQGNFLTGFEILEPSRLVRSAIRKFFESELMGQNLLPLESEPHRETGRPRIRRFADQQENQVTIHEIDFVVTGFLISILGHEIHWSQSGRVVMKENEALVPISDYIRQQTIKLVQNMGALEASLQEQVERILLTL